MVELDAILKVRPKDKATRKELADLIKKNRLAWIEVQQMKKHYLRTTKNLYFINEGSLDNGIRIFYSYNTPIAFEKGHRYEISQNVWSVTTAKHLTWIEDFLGLPDAVKKRGRIPYSDFKKYLDIETQKSNQRSLDLEPI